MKNFSDKAHICMIVPPGERCCLSGFQFPVRWTVADRNWLGGTQFLESGQGGKRDIRPARPIVIFSRQNDSFLFHHPAPWSSHRFRWSDDSAMLIVLLRIQSDGMAVILHFFFGSFSLSIFRSRGLKGLSRSFFRRSDSDAGVHLWPPIYPVFNVA